MQVDLARYDDVVHSIYDAALRPEQWPAALAQAAALLGATRSMLFTWKHSPVQGGFIFRHNLPEVAPNYWVIKNMFEDPFAKAAVARGLTGEGMALIGSDLVPMAELQTTDFYKRLWAPVNIGHMCFGHVFDGTDAHKLPTVLTFLRSLSDAPFEQGHAELLRRLLAHMARAMGVMFHLRDSEWRIAANEAALDRLGSGVVLVDAARKVQFANQQAQGFFVRADTLLLGSVGSATPLQMRLHQRLAPFERSFQQAITQALQPLEQDVTEHFSQALLLPADDGRPACVVHAVPLARSHSFASGGSHAKAIVFLYDLQSVASVEPTLLCDLFGMTQAEARTALQLTLGGNIDQMAARLGIAPSTFKTQLQAAYMKSSTGRQADLLKLLLALATR